MNAASTLFYDERDYKRAIATLERLSAHMLCKFAVVGGLANRSLFPEWGERMKGKRFNDIDVVLLPSAVEAGKPLLDPSLKNDFYVNHISVQFDGYYWSMIDRVDHVGVDVFTRQRDVETREVLIGGKPYAVLTNEELYLRQYRDTYETLNRGWGLDPKHLAFLEFLRDKVDQSKVSELWKVEAPVIRFRTDEYEFEAMDEYFEQVAKMVSDKKAMIEEKIPGTQKRQYGKSPLAEAWGIAIENEADFHASNALKRGYWPDA